MAYSPAVNAYKNVQSQAEAETASPEQLVKLLFAALMKDLYQAKGFMSRGQHSEKGICLGKAMDILVTLDLAVDMEAGGELSVNLKNVYQYSMQQLVKANADNDISVLNEVIGLLGGLKSAWDTIEKPSSPEQGADDE